MGSGSSAASVPSLPPAALIQSAIGLVDNREYQGLRNLLSSNRHGGLTASDWADVAGTLLEKASGCGCLEIMELLIGMLPRLGASACM